MRRQRRIGFAVKNYCESKKEIPIINGETSFTSFKNNGTVAECLEGVQAQCWACMSSNSCGPYGCPRINAGLPLNEFIVEQ